MWSRVWQMACREEDIPNPGDVHVFELGDSSILVVRVSPTEIRAYYNACLHRGTLLCDRDANLPHFRCPFHGWTWNLEGELTFLPSGWDFPHVDPSAINLPEVNLDIWEGFVFINLDDDPVPAPRLSGDPARAHGSVRIRQPVQGGAPPHRDQCELEADRGGVRRGVPHQCNPSAGAHLSDAPSLSRHGTGQERGGAHRRSCDGCVRRSCDRPVGEPDGAHGTSRDQTAGTDGRRDLRPVLEPRRRRRIRQPRHSHLLALPEFRRLRWQLPDRVPGASVPERPANVHPRRPAPVSEADGRPG